MWEKESAVRDISTIFCTDLFLFKHVRAVSFFYACICVDFLSYHDV